MSQEAPNEVKLPDSALPADKGQEYAEAMIKKAEGEKSEADGKKGQEQEPQLIAGKFKTQEDLVKAYEELQKKLGAPKEAEPVKKPEAQAAPEKKAEGAEAEDEVAKQVVEEAGLDINVLSAEWAEKGELSEENYAKLEKAGIPKAVVLQFAAGQDAIRAANRSAVMNSVGGEDKYGELMEFAKNNLTAEEQSAYNKIANSGDIAAIKIAAKGLQSRFEQENGREPSLINGGISAGAGYRSMDELKADMKKPEYANDPAFRADVERRLKATTAF